MSVFQLIGDLITELAAQDIRLWLEDDQLRFSAPKGGMSETTRDKLKRHKTAIIEFLRQSGTAPSPELQKVDYSQLQPLSYAQERIWFLCQLDPDNAAFHLPNIFTIRGQLDKPLLEKVLNTLVARHSILRTAYVQTETGVFQHILPEKQLLLHETRLSEPVNPAQLDEPTLQAMALAAAGHRFDLEKGDVAHCQLITVRDDFCILVCTIHHIAADGWSMNIFAKEIAFLYESLAAQQPVTLTEPAFQYADFSVWQRLHNESAQIQQQLAFWKKELDGIENLRLPYDFPRTTALQHKGKSQRFTLDATTTLALNKLAHDNHATLYMILLSLFSTLLYRYSQQALFCIGTPIAGRSNSYTENMIGCFLNMIAIKSQHQPDETFVQLLARHREVIQTAFAHQDIPFEQVVKAVVKERNLAVTPLFQVLFGLQNMPLDEISHINGIEIHNIETNKQNALYDLSLSMNEWHGEIVAELDYKEALFSDNSIAAMIDSFKRLIHSVIDNPEQKTGTIDIISNEDKHRQLHVWNQTQLKRTNSPAGLHQFIEQHANTTPDAIALQFNDSLVNYQSLNAQANQLAHYLIQQQYDKTNIIGVCLDRSEQLPIALLAILKCGCAYVPFDLSFPQERLNTIAEDAGITIFLSESHVNLWQMPTNIQRINLDEISVSSLAEHNPDTSVAEKALFNIIYTSGSTGQPKGVMVSHAAMINRLCWMQETFPLSGSDVVLQKTPYSFDVSVWEIFLPLMFGSKLVLATPQGHKNPGYLRDLIQQENISIVHFVPSMLSIFLQTEGVENCTSLRKVFCSGETLSSQLANQFHALFPQQQLINLYGPTEAAIDVSYHVCQPQQEVIPIGKPISNTQLYVLDEQQQLLPTGAIGEIIIGGDNLAEGYINKPELSQQVFITNPFAETQHLSKRLYKSGDMGRFDEQGNLYFLGRNDQQVKIRGFRIELQEISQQLNKHPQVQESLVTTQSNNSHNTRIVAYYISRSGELNPQMLRDYLLHYLPGFMIPANFIAVSAWPLGSSGKIDYRKLPDPDRSNMDSQAYIAPRNAIEEKLAQVWSELLEIEKIGIHDNFFELGGHSLLATLAIARLQKEFNVSIPLRDIFRNPTIANIASAIATAQNAATNNTFSQPLADDEEEITL